MPFRSPLLRPFTKQPTSQANAWKDNQYESYQLAFELPAVRVHGRFKPAVGKWFAVDTYNVALDRYQGMLALVTSHKRPHSWFFKRPGLAWFVLQSGTIVNVGLAATQGQHEGGGLQFEHVGGPLAQLLEQAADHKTVRL